MTQKRDETRANSVIKLECGCEYQDEGWILIRLQECQKHKKQRTTPRPKRPKAECVRAGGKYD